MLPQTSPGEMKGSRRQRRHRDKREENQNPRPTRRVEPSWEFVTIRLPCGQIKLPLHFEWEEAAEVGLMASRRTLSQLVEVDLEVIAPSILLSSQALLILTPLVLVVQAAVVLLLVLVAAQLPLLFLLQRSPQMAVVVAVLVIMTTPDLAELAETL